MVTRQPTVAPPGKDTPELPSSSANPQRVQVRKRNGVWEVKVDGVFRGDYLKEANARAAAARAKHSLR